MAAARAKGRAAPKAAPKGKGKAKAKARARAAEEEEEEEEEGGEVPNGGIDLGDGGGAAGEAAEGADGDAAAQEEAAAEEVGEEGTGARQRGFRMRGVSFLLTYNYRFLSRPLPDGAPPFASAAALWEAWKAWQEERVEALAIKQYTSTVEESLNSLESNRVHIHFKINFKEISR